MNIDLLAEKIYELTPYNYVQNSPLSRMDPDGLTDYSLNRRTGEVEQVGDKNDEPDRILKTNRKGEVKYNKNGEAKVAIGGIEQGILRDGQNLKTEDNLIAVGGEGQPTQGGVESFALQLSDYIGKEIGGSYFSKDESKNTTHVSIGKYENNSFQETKSHGNNMKSLFNNSQEANRYTITGLYHTHPGYAGGSIKNSDRLVPSAKDRGLRDSGLKINNNLLFILLTHPESPGGKSPYRIDYTKGYLIKDR